AVLLGNPNVFAQTDERVHVVVKGDTLWDISSVYLYDPFMWPRVWNANRNIENPHLIHPGQEIIIPAELIELAVAPPPEPIPQKPVLPPPPPEPVVVEKPAPPPVVEKPVVEKPVEIPMPVEKKQELIRAMATYGFIVKKKEIGIGTITASEENRLLISPTNIVFITTPGKQPLTNGEKYSIVKIFDEIRHPQTNKRVGYMAKVLGDLSVLNVKGRLATAKVGSVYRAVEIGDQVMEHVEYLSWIPKAESMTAEALEGVVLANPEGKTLMGKGDVFFLNLGLAQGIKPGDRLRVVAERGRIKSPVTSRKLSPPDEVLGVVEIVVPRENTSVARITASYKEIPIGAKVVSFSR
ncbi:MAG: LysM peptidoglycan-binding domain-containing protein, partial [bacterium]